MRIDNPISDNAIITGSFTGSFSGDGTNLTGVTAEWDGSHVGNASITGNLTVSADLDANTVTTSTLTLGATDVTATGAELNFVDGVTSNVQTQLDAKASDSDLTTFIARTDNPHSVTATQVGLGNVDNTSDTNKPVSTATQTALDAKAPLASPTFTGTVTVPTPDLSDDSTKAATTAYVQDKIQEVVAAAPAALDTLNELAAAIGDDANFAGTVTTALGEKLVKASNLSDLTDASAARTNLGLGTAATTAAADYATAAQGALADSALQDADLSGGTGVTYSSGVISIGQSVGTGDTVQFNVIRATGDVVAYYSSDKLLKDNIQPLDGALDKVKRMGGYSFDWNDKQSTYEAGMHDIGVIAQEVKTQYPELVTERDNGYLAVDYVKLTAVLLQAVKELSKQVEGLQGIKDPV